MADLIERYAEKFMNNWELQAKILIYGQWLVLIMTLIGFGIMAYMYLR